MQNVEYTQKPFAEALDDLMRERDDRDTLGRINLKALFAKIPGWEYEYLRKMVVGERRLMPTAIEAVANVLDIAPSYFLEYRLWQIQEGFRRHPTVADDVYRMLMASFAVLDQTMGESPPDADEPRGGG